MIWSYSSPKPLGHKLTEYIGEGIVLIQEKVDGSQFSFGKVADEVFCKSKNQILDVTHVDGGLFGLAIQTVLSLELPEGYVFRGEVLATPKHNVLAYDRVPRGNVIIYDVETKPGDFMCWEHARDLVNSLGLEYVPVFHYGELPSQDKIESFLNNTSVLGGQLVEGIVIKNYNQWLHDKVLMAKLVRSDFKEQHKILESKKGEFVQDLGRSYATVARWRKAVQHLREQGLITDSPKDIGLLLKEVNQDVLTECQDEIKETLFKHYWKTISREITRGLPDWYKGELNAY